MEDTDKIPGVKPGRSQEKIDLFSERLTAALNGETATLFAGGVELGMRHLKAFRQYVVTQMPSRSERRDVLGGLIMEHVEVKAASGNETRVEIDYLRGAVTLFVPDQLPGETDGSAAIRKAQCVSSVVSEMKKTNDESYLHLASLVPLEDRERFAAKYLGDDKNLSHSDEKGG